MKIKFLYPPQETGSSFFGLLHWNIIYWELEPISMESWQPWLQVLNSDNTRHDNSSSLYLKCYVRSSCPVVIMIFVVVWSSAWCLVESDWWNGVKTMTPQRDSGKCLHQDVISSKFKILGRVLNFLEWKSWVRLFESEVHLTYKEAHVT